MTLQPSEQPRRYTITRQTLATALHGLTVGRGGLATCYHAAEGSECDYTAARIIQELAIAKAAAPDPVATPPEAVRLLRELVAVMEPEWAEGIVDNSRRRDGFRLLTEARRYLASTEPPSND